MTLLIAPKTTVIHYTLDISLEWSLPVYKIKDSMSNLEDPGHSIEPEEPYISDNDSTYYDDEACSTHSIRSSIYDYEESNGRSYHAYHAGKYYVPNDAVRFRAVPAIRC